MSDFTAGPQIGDSRRAILDETYADPDLDGVTIGAEESDLDALRAELTGVTVDDTTLIPVELRPGYAVRCRLDFTARDLDGIRKQAKDKRFADNLDGIKFAALLMGLTVVAVERKGKPITHEGRPVTLATREFQAVIGGTKVDDTARALFVREGSLDAAVRRLTTEAGWGEDLYALDPTA